MAKEIKEQKPPKEKGLAKVETPPDENNPMSLIAKAIKEKIPVETMERLLALQERWEKNVAKKEFDRAMAKFQSECPVIEKTKPVYEKDGRTVRYKYAVLDSIVEQVKKPLSDNGLSYNFDEEKDEKFTTIICIVTHYLGHSQRTTFKIPIGTEAYMSDVQKYGARMTFGKRYAFCNAFGIMTGDEDTDGVDTAKKQETPAGWQKPVVEGVYKEKPAQDQPAQGKAKVTWVPKKDGACPICGQKAKWGEGEKVGKKWAGLFCQNPECKHVAWQTNTPYNQKMMEETEKREKGQTSQMDDIRHEEQKNDDDGIPIINE